MVNSPTVLRKSCRLTIRLVGPNRAKELSFTGRYVSAQEAYQIGLVNRVVPHDQLMAVAEGMAQDMLSVNQQALRKNKYLIQEGLNIELEAGLALESLESLRWRGSQRQLSPEQTAKVRDEVFQKGREQQKRNSS